VCKKHSPIRLALEVLPVRVFGALDTGPLIAGCHG
jgi:hypothetical protein